MGVGGEKAKKMMVICRGEAGTGGVFEQAILNRGWDG